MVNQLPARLLSPRSSLALCTKSVSQLSWNQMLPHSFWKLPGVHQQFPFWFTQRTVEGCYKG